MNPYENYVYNGNKEIKIYSLDKKNEKDDKMIIQINSCSGNYDVKLSKKIVTYDDNRNDIQYETVGGIQGRKTYIINNLRYKHVYLSIKSAQNEQECSNGNEMDKNNNTCARELSYLLFYYSTSSQRQFTDNNIYQLKYRLDTRANFYLYVPEINNIDVVTDFIIKATYFLDNPALNCFPSIHCLFCFQVILTTILSKNIKFKYKFLITIVSFLIIMSTVLVKQHYFLDILGALIICIIA